MLSRLYRPHTHPGIKPHPANATKCLAVLVALTGLSYYIILRNASNEPYTIFQWPDVLEQVAFGYAISLAWLYYLCTLFRDLTHEKLSLPWLAALPWAVAMFFLVQYSANGYIEDITRFGK